jgi:pimeloyl-ACP methyl ester carboxylesterase
MEALEPANEAWSVRRLVGGLGSPTRWQRRFLKRRFQSAGLKPHLLNLDPGHLHVWAGGKGSETLVLLHGFGGSCLWQWAEMVGALAKRYKLLVPDLLWFGQSDGKSNERSLEAQAQAILALIDKNGTEPVHLAGISYGGFVSYLIANDHPNRVRSLTLIDCPATVMTAEDYQEVLERYGLNDMGPMLVPESADGLPRLMSLAYHRPPPIPRFALSDAHRILFGEHRQQRLELLDNLVAYLDQPREHGDSNHPVLIVWGEFDNLFPPALGLRLKQRFGARAEMVIIPNAAHAPIIEHPRAVNECLLNFLGAQAQN